MSNLTHSARWSISRKNPYLSRFLKTRCDFMPDTLRMAKYKDDYFFWDDDLDLDHLLGEYTEDENDKVKTQESLTVYACPVCEKEYRTISGFRGHVLKKHQQNLRATDYKRNKDNLKTKAPIRQEILVTETATNYPKEQELIPRSIYSDIFSTAYIQAVEEIETSPIHNLFGKSAISEIATHCKNNDTIINKMKVTFSLLTSAPVNIVLSEDRESLFRKIHAMRFSADIKVLIQTIQTTHCPVPESINHFLQIFLLQFTKSLLDQYANTKKTAYSEDSKQMTVNDQKVLFYIAGYMINTLKKKVKKINDQSVKEFKMSIIDSLQTDEKHSNYLSKYTSMFEKKNRGGLKYPNENFFLLIRSMEIVTRKHTTKMVTSKTLDKGVLKETVLEDFMVKYYAEKMFAVNTDESNSQISPEQVLTDLTEDIINLFLTIRGFAFARVEKNKIKQKTQGQKTCSTGESLRGALKAKCMNTQ